MAQPPNLPPAPVSITPQPADQQRVAERMGALAAATKAAREAAEAHAHALADPRYREAMRQIDALTASTTRLAAAERSQEQMRDRRRRLGSGEYAADQKRDQALAAENNRLAERERRTRLASGLTLAAAREELRTKAATARLGERERRQQLDGGHYAAGYGEQKRAGRAASRLAELERRERNRADYGRAGGAAVSAVESRAGRAATGALAAGVASAQRHVMSGFSNTAEMERFNGELEGINREMAGAFKPAIEWATKGLQEIRLGMEKLTPSQQKVVMVAGLVAGGLIAANRVLGTFGTNLIRASMAAAKFSAAAAKRAGGGGGSGNVSGFGGRGKGSKGRAKPRSKLRNVGKAGGLTALFASAVGVARSATEASGEHGHVEYARYQGWEGTKGLAVGGARSFNDNALNPLARALGFEEAFGEWTGARDAHYQPQKDNAQKFNDMLMGRPSSTPAERDRVTVKGGGFNEAGSGWEKLSMELTKKDTTQATIDTAAGVDRLVNLASQFLGRTGNAADAPGSRRS